jgi:hypothetical protein
MDGGCHQGGPGLASLPRSAWRVQNEVAPLDMGLPGCRICAASLVIDGK